MKRLHRLVCLAALIVAPLAAACGGHEEEVGASTDDFTRSITVGTYLTSAPPLGGTYAARITFAAGDKFEADIVTARGDKVLLAGSYVILAAQPNNPDSPVKSDKPTLVLRSDSGGADVSFEFDRVSGSALRLFTSARQASFTMTRDPSFVPAPTDRKVIVCTGNTVDAKLTVDQAQGRRGTLEVTRKPGADRHDPPSAVVAMTRNDDEHMEDRIHMDGRKGQQDYFVNMLVSDFERGTGDIPLNFNWAEDGQEFGVGVRCKFGR